MFQKIDLQNLQKLESLHDCETSSFDFSANKLAFYFMENGLNILSCNGERLYPYKQLKLTYILAKTIDYNIGEDCSVKQINEREKFVKKAMKQFSLKEFIIFLKKNKGNLRFFSQYYNKEQCIIFAELIRNNEWQMGNWFEIELLVDEIIYEWIE